MFANGTTGPLAANIDEVSVHNRVLTGAEVTAMYNSGDPTNLSLLASYSSVMYWWRMGDGDTYPIIDDRTDNQDLQMYNSLPSQIEGVVP
jgi:hypothetical protein